jgi:hypothetical protein
MSDLPEWIDQQIQQRLIDLETQGARREAILQHTQEDTRAMKCTNNQLLCAVKDIQNTLRFQRWLFRAGVTCIGVLLFMFGKVSWDDISTVTKVIRKGD